METVLECPLGAKCESAGKDGKLHRCIWYMKMAGRAADGTVYDQWNCAMVWMPILMVENSAAVRSTAAAVESLRNETVVRQDAAMNLLRGNVNAKEITNN